MDRLYGKVGFPRQGSSATLTGRSWFLQSGAQPEHRFVAAYNGDSVQRTQAAAAPDPKTASVSSSTQTTAPTSSNGSRTTLTEVYGFTTTISSGSTKPGKVSRTAQRLVTCISHAQGDVSKIVVCQRKFVPQGAGGSSSAEPPAIASPGARSGGSDRAVGAADAIAERRHAQDQVAGAEDRDSEPQDGCELDRDHDE